MRGKENKERNEKIVRLWNTGRYKTYSSLARLLRLKHPKIVERAIKKEKARQNASLARAYQIAAENQNANDSLHD